MSNRIVNGVGIGLLLVAVGCAAPGEESEVIDLAPPSTGKADGTTLDHGAMDIRQSTLFWNLEITATQRAHSWDFELSGDAMVSLRAGKSLGRRAEQPVHTSLVVYRLPEGGDPVALRRARRIDEFKRSFVRELSAGRYRIVLTADGEENGWVSLDNECSGAGCYAPPQPGECVFGSDIFELEESQRWTFDEAVTITPASANELEGRQILTGIRAIRGEEIATLAAAFEETNDGKIRKERITEASGEYGSYLLYRAEFSEFTFGFITDEDGERVVATLGEEALDDCLVVHHD